MNSPYKFLVSAAFAVASATATTNYVDLSGTHVPPFTNWVDAATNIQAAVDVASSGDLVLVAAGIYNSGGRPEPGASLVNRIMITNTITVRSVLGPEATIVVGKGPWGSEAERCVYISNRAVLAGFTLSNGWTRVDTNGTSAFDGMGGGVCAVGFATVTNCAIRNCGAVMGGGVFCCWWSLLTDCIIAGNSSTGISTAGGADVRFGGRIAHCVIAGNHGASIASVGGLYLFRWSTAAFCRIEGNWNEGGAYSAQASLLDCCIITGNFASLNGGGVRLGTAIRNSLVANNSCSNNGGGIAVSGYQEMYNCTVADNCAAWGGGGLYLYDGAWLDTVNSIVASNTAPNGPNWFMEGSGTAVFQYCCSPGLTANGCITNDPAFLDQSMGDYHLQPASPCMDAGTNMDWMAAACDLDGNPRIDGTTVDLGAYEFVPEPAAGAAIVVGYSLLVIGAKRRSRPAAGFSIREKRGEN